MIKLTRGQNNPKRGSQKKIYPFKTMVVGDSFSSPSELVIKKKGKDRCSFCAICKKRGTMFITRTIENGVRWAYLVNRKPYEMCTVSFGFTPPRVSRMGFKDCFRGYIGPVIKRAGPLLKFFKILRSSNIVNNGLVKLLRPQNIIFLIVSTTQLCFYTGRSLKHKTMNVENQTADTRLSQDSIHSGIYWPDTWRHRTQHDRRGAGRWVESKGSGSYSTKYVNLKLYNHESNVHMKHWVVLWQ